jgi:hypothetical protein
MARSVYGAVAEPAGKEVDRRFHKVHLARQTNGRYIGAKDSAARHRIRDCCRFRPTFPEFHAKISAFQRKRLTAILYLSGSSLALGGAQQLGVALQCVQHRL